MLTLKSDVQLVRCDPRMVLADLIISQIYARYGLRCQITSGTDGVHPGRPGHPSLHPKGLAHDYGTKDIEAQLPPAIVRGTNYLAALVGDIVAALPGYVVLYEGPTLPPGLEPRYFLLSTEPHIHVEFNPPYPFF